MSRVDYLYGPIPSRRLGRSLGFSPTRIKTCQFNCIYCQLGATKKTIQRLFKSPSVEDILREFDCFLETNEVFDTASIVGNGEPTLYAHLGELIDGIKARTNKPVALITNGATLFDERIVKSVQKADIVLPTLNGYDENSYQLITRAHASLPYETVLNGLKTFSQTYQGQLWLEIMFIKGVNDHDYALEQYKNILQTVSYDRLYLNTPVRPPTESTVEPPSPSRMKAIAKALGGFAIDFLSSEAYHSHEEDPVEAIKHLIKYHPMHQFEIAAFLKERTTNIDEVLYKLDHDASVEKQHYRGFESYRLK